jgi:hypothetical protein
VDHTCAKLDAIPLYAIDEAKAQLHIAYGHTSHGSQLTEGMSALSDWKGGTQYAWAGSGDGVLILEDYYGDFGGYGANDLGNPDGTAWAAATRSFLNERRHADVNVIMWSWCGQVAWASEADIDTYLSLMNALETDFPDVTFVYMTCHLDGTGAEGNLNKRNEQIRAYCRQHNKVLYDFADIESFDPDGLVDYMELYANDNCDYTPVGGGSANWALDWQASHTENVDWFACSAAHSQSLVGNLKAYAAWHLFARLGGWSGAPGWSGRRGRERWYPSWYGWFYWDASFGDWIYSPEHGFQYVWPTSESTAVVLWDAASQSWWWTCEEECYPMVYVYGRGWFYYLGGEPGNRTFWDYTAERYITM